MIKWSYCEVDEEDLQSVYSLYGSDGLLKIALLPCFW